MYPGEKKIVSETNFEKVRDQKNFISIEIRIADNGQGISKEGLEKLFINFNKLDEHTNSNSNGTGLGLSICKKIIQQMGGNIQCKSEVGVGTEFTIYLNTRCKCILTKG